MEQKNYQLSFSGKGLELFKIQIVNFILNVLTIGLFYPWAKARKLQYLYSNTIFEESPFTFTGTGKEMFKGFIKAILFVILAYLVFFTLVFMHLEQFAVLFLYAFIHYQCILRLGGWINYRSAFRGGYHRNLSYGNYHPVCSVLCLLFNY